MGISNIFNREKNKINRRIQRLKDFASEFSENLKTAKSIEGFEDFEGFEALFGHLRNMSSSLFVMPGDDLLKYLDLKSTDTQERDYINNKYTKDKIEELDRLIIFTVVLGEYLLRVLERLSIKSHIKILKTMTKYIDDDVIGDVIALAYDYPEIDESKFIPLEDLFRRLVETKKVVGLMLFCLLGKKDENNKRMFSLKTHYKLLSAIRKNDFELFVEVVEESDDRLADSLSMIYANMYPFAVAMESYSSKEVSLDDVQEFLSSNGYEIITHNSPTSKIVGNYIGVVYMYLAYIWGEFPNEAKGIDYFFELNGLSDFMHLYAEWCYEETELLIDAKKEAKKNNEQTQDPSTEIDNNRDKDTSFENNNDTDQSEDDKSPTSGNREKTRTKDPNYYIHVDEKPEVIKMLVEGLVQGYTTEEFGSIPSLVTTERLYDDYDDIEELLTFFFTGDKSNFSKRIPYKLKWNGTFFYLYLLMQLIFNKKELKKADDVINKSENPDPSDSLISKTHVKADFRRNNALKEIEAVFGIKPNSIKNSTPTISQKNEETEQMMIKLAQFWLDCKEAGKG